MIDSMNNGGRIALLGLFNKDVAIDWSRMVFKGLFIKGIYGREMLKLGTRWGSLLQSGLKISQVITHHFSMEEFEKGFEIMNNGNCGKVILNWEP